jgi:hypothetical protein
MHRVADARACSLIAFAPRARDDAGVMKQALSFCLFVAMLAMGCEDKPSEKPMAEAGAATAAPTPTPTAPEPPKPPKIVVEPGSFAINAERVNPTDPDPIGQIASLITGKPQVENAMVELDVKRAVKPSQMWTMIQALKKAKAKGAIARTENRDKVITPFEITFPSPQLPACTVVGYIAKDARINVWPIGGGAAKVYSKGFAGPDMTLGTEGVRDLVGRCDATILLVGADDAMTWGLVFDLATISKSSGATKITQFGIVPGTVVPGRKVTIE